MLQKMEKVAFVSLVYNQNRHMSVGGGGIVANYLIQFRIMRL